MFRIIRKSLQKWIVTGKFPASDRVVPEAGGLLRNKAKWLRKSLAIRAVDTGSCNACEMEMNALMNPIYDAERLGLHVASSPRHADALVVTGPVTINMERSLKDVYRMTPDPKVVIALGDCAIHCGMFKGSYAVSGPVEKHVPVDFEIPGCPPRPAEILEALSAHLGLGDEKKEKQK